jgi:hypothetical protein
MIRVLDAATSSLRPLRPALPGLLRITAHCADDATPGLDLTALRVLLVADVLARVAELSGLQAVVAHVSCGPLVRLQDEVGVSADTLGIHPPAGSADTVERLPEPCDRPSDVHILCPYDTPDPRWAGITTMAGTARRGRTGSDEDARLWEVLASDAADLAVRMVLMSVAYSEEADLTADSIVAARETIDEWRQLVAEWAEYPSMPVPAQIIKTMRGAFDDLDTPSVLASLRDLTSDGTVQAGARFEAFAFADRVLGLDLARNIGIAHS